MINGLKKLGFGVVGLGRIGRIHAEIIKFKIDEAKLVAVCDISKELATSVAGKFGVKAFTNYDEMLKDPEIDAVVIATPTFLHKDMIIKALENKKHVFVEKPITVTSSEAKEVVAAVRRYSMKLQVGYMRRFDYAYKNAKKIIDEGKIGKPITFISIARDPGAPPGWAADPKLSGGIFLDMLSHDFDMARWLMSSEVVEVYVIGGNYIYEEIKAKGDLDVVSINFKFSSGAQGIIHGSRKSAFGYDLRTEVLGTEGTVYVGSNIDNMFSCGLKEGIMYQGIPWFERRFYDAYVEELKHFINAVLKDEEPLITAEDGLKVVQIAEACWKSVKEGKPISISY